MSSHSPITTAIEHGEILKIAYRHGLDAVPLGDLRCDFLEQLAPMMILPRPLRGARVPKWHHQPPLLGHLKHEYIRYGEDVRPKDEILEHQVRCLLLSSQLTQLDLLYDSLQESLQETKQAVVGPYLKFASKFECGNLWRVYAVSERHYLLFVRPDKNIQTHGLHTQWFLFQVSRWTPGIKYRFEVMNMEKIRSTSTQGMQPVMYSGDRWIRRADHVDLFRNRILRFHPEYTPKLHYGTLAFEMDFDNVQGDYALLAYHYPYTYSFLRSFLQQLENHQIQGATFSSLCMTLSGHPCPLIRLESTPSNPYIILTARVHPGETPSSWLMHGILDYLFSPLATASHLRAHFNFLIIPMLNPDGVIEGSHRCNLSGADLNRHWHSPSAQWHPTIYHAKQFITELVKSSCTRVVMFCDFHGHARELDIFLYACSKTERSCAFIDLLCQLNKSEFNREKCTFDQDQDGKKQSTARYVMAQELGIEMSFTCESTYAGSKERQFTPEDYIRNGVHFCETLWAARAFIVDS